jgi:hypothetical protein
MFPNSSAAGLVLCSGDCHGLTLFKQPRQDSHQCPLLADGETSEGRGRRGHAIEQKRAQPRTGWREIQDFYPAVLGRWTATYETARLEPVHQPGHVRRVAGERLGELPHRDRSARLDEVQHVALRRRELELRGKRGQVRALSEEELDEQLPRVAGVGARGLHHRTV